MTTVAVNFGQLLQSMTTEIKLTITRGGVVGEGPTDNVIPVLHNRDGRDSSWRAQPKSNLSLRNQIICFIEFYLCY